MSFLTSLRPTPTFTRLVRPALNLQHQSRRGLAKMTIIGRLGDTPEKAATATGGTIVRYALATNSGPRDNRQTSWWRVVSFSDSEKLQDTLTGLGKG